jgi:hypothetical protein
MFVRQLAFMCDKLCKNPKIQHCFTTLNMGFWENDSYGSGQFE